MILLFGTHYGLDTSELDSGYLIWVIEKYEKADWSLIQACKQELFARLKLDWTPPIPEEDALKIKVKSQEKTIKSQSDKIDLLEKCLIMATCFKANRVTIDGYLQNPKLLNQNINLIRSIQE